MIAAASLGRDATSILARGGVNDRELTIQLRDATLPATLTLPEGPVRGGIVPLHPASDASRGQFLFEHLANVLTPSGIAVLRYDRRGRDEHGGDIPFAAQAEDALAALELLRSVPEVGPVPVGLWGWSQGAWAAPLAATLSADVAFLVLIAATGVSPAKQMRYGTAEQLRRGGFAAEDIAELGDLRAAYESGLRTGEVSEAQAVVNRYAERAWFPLAYVPLQLDPGATWIDMDFNPAPVLAEVRCPVLLFYGESDEWTPIDDSIAAWRRAAERSGNRDIEVVRLSGSDHAPTFGGRAAGEAISPQYTEKLLAWVDRIVAAS